jgi:hypothetical protein
VEAGGLRAAGHIFVLAGALDTPCIIGSQAELGIGLRSHHRSTPLQSIRNKTTRRYFRFAPETESHPVVV